MNLAETLDEYKNKDIYPFHMPGHKRNLAGEEYKIDMTEVEGVDDLHDPEGPILEDQKKFAKLYGADECYLLVGGSTVGNLAAVFAATNEGDKILIQRNSHKSVYNAGIIRHNKILYLTPKVNEIGICNAVTPKEIEEEFEREENIKALVLTSPTYEGYHANLEEIARICHKRDVTLIVDQAHGAHLGFSEQFKESAAGIADITIVSLHKTLPCLTQTALLFVKGKKVKSERIKEALDIFETSSPSYVLMNSISKCGEFLTSKDDYFKGYVDNLANFYERCGDLQNLEIVVDDLTRKDPGKLIISTKNTNITGVELAERLRNDFGIETEMASFAYVIAMTSIMDTKEGFNRLIVALHTIDIQLKKGSISIPSILVHPKKRIEPWKAKSGEETDVKISEANSLISAGMICIYPPGSPIAVPGEEITPEVIALIEKAKNANLHVTGIHGDSITVVN